MVSSGVVSVVVTEGASCDAACPCQANARKLTRCRAGRLPGRRLLGCPEVVNLCYHDLALNLL